LNIIRDRVDAFVHPSTRYDALTRARHRAFIAPRLLGSLALLAAFPVYLAMRGAPTATEVAALAWLIAPIGLSWFLSRTGYYEGAHVLSSVALATVAMAAAMISGGIESSAAVWLMVVPLEAALCASRRALVFGIGLSVACTTLLLVLGHFDALPSPDASAELQRMLMGCSILAASIYAAALGFAAASLAGTGRGLLHVEEERYRLLAHHMGEVISRHRRDGSVQFISPAAEAMFGARLASLHGHGLFDRVHVADRPAYLTVLSDAACGNECRTVEIRIRRENAGEARRADFIWIEMRCRPLEERVSAPAGRAEVVAAMHDITDRKSQEHALELARSAAERADAARTRFLANVSHELRTPLNAIIGFSEMIAQEETLLLDAARRNEYARLINESGQHLLSVVNGILDQSKMEAGNFEIAPEPFNARASLLGCCDMLAMKAHEHEIDLATSVPDDLPLVTGDPRAFKQVVLNLLSNAIKFTERGGKVMVSATVEGSRLVLRVTDTGVGIADDDLKKIGDPFFQAGKTYQRRYEGTGLGLSIVKSLVALHGGKLTVQSKLDQGTTVTVALPLAFTPTQAETEREPAGNVAMLNPRSAVQVDQVKRSA
jgi:two-component system, cell cycle sensor histidine kinase DivJ